jgi:hypothetical protein
VTREPGPPEVRPRRVPRALLVIAAVVIALVAIEFYALFTYGRVRR